MFTTSDKLARLLINDLVSEYPDLDESKESHWSLFVACQGLALFAEFYLSVDPQGAAQKIADSIGVEKHVFDEKLLQIVKKRILSMRLYEETEIPKFA